MANPRGRPKVENKWAWVVTDKGVIPVEVRKHQGVYKTFIYDTEKQRTSFLKEVKTPIYDSLEEANKNAPIFEGFKEDYLGIKEGGPRYYQSKYGYELSPDNKLYVVEYRYNPASGARKEGYRRYKYSEGGQATLGKLAPGELFDSPDLAIDDYKTNYSNGKLIDWEAFEQSQADIAAREPTPEELEKYQLEQQSAWTEEELLEMNEEANRAAIQEQEFQQAEIEYEKQQADMAAREPSPEQLEQYIKSQEWSDFSDEDIARLQNNVDEVTGVRGAGGKALGLVAKLGWADDLAIKAITTQIPKLFAGTMLAGAAGTAGAGIAALLSAWSLGNLAIAAVRGAGTFAKEYGGDTLAALDAIAAGEIPEKTFVEAAKESFFEGAGEFGEQMQYDPFVMTIDKGFQMASGGRMQGQEDVFLKPAGWAWNAIKNNMVNPTPGYHSNYLPGGK